MLKTLKLQLEVRRASCFRGLGNQTQESKNKTTNMQDQADLWEDQACQITKN
jgi:hypothetical protein